MPLIIDFFILYYTAPKTEKRTSLPMVSVAHFSDIVGCVYSACIYRNLRPAVSQAKVHKQTVLHKIVTG
nr:MAG TPA: hypothetical protein [Caudoviricetes sp.]